MFQMCKIRDNLMQYDHLQGVVKRDYGECLPDEHNNSQVRGKMSINVQEKKPIIIQQTSREGEDRQGQYGQFFFDK